MWPGWESKLSWGSLTRLPPGSDRLRPSSLPPNLVAKLDHAILVRRHIQQVKLDVFVELLEKGDAVTDQNREDRVTDFVGQAEAKAFTRHRAASHKPDAAEGWLEPSIHQCP